MALLYGAVFIFFFALNYRSETSTVLHDRLLAIAYRCSKWSWL